MTTLNWMCDDSAKADAATICTECGASSEDGLTMVVLEDGEDATRSSPGYDPTFGALCPQCLKKDEHLAVVVDDACDERYEWAVSRARSNDFKDTGGKDWT